MTPIASSDLFFSSFVTNDGFSSAIAGSHSLYDASLLLSRLAIFSCVPHCSLTFLPILPTHFATLHTKKKRFDIVFITQKTLV